MLIPKLTQISWHYESKYFSRIYIAFKIWIWPDIRSQVYVPDDYKRLRFYLEGSNLLFHTCQKLKEELALDGFVWLGLKYVRWTIRDYIFIIHPDHHDSITFKVDEFLKTNWSSIFSMLNLSTSYHQSKPIKKSLTKKSSASQGYVNRNNQINMRRTNTPGTDHCQWFYQMKCQECGYE